jgi:hypothetical protein
MTRRGAFHSQPRTRHSTAAVRAAVQSRIDASPDGVLRGETVVPDIQRQLNGTWIWSDQATNGQIRRALDAMARSGELVKVPRGRYGPDGRRDTRAATYYTRAAFAAAEVQRGRDEAQVAVIRQRWELVYDALGEMGIVPVTLRGKPVKLDLPRWEQLAGLDHPLASSQESS